MKEVVIKAPKILVVQKGDTLIYNADLLELAQSAMLKELIKVLPDVHIDTDGRITVKGELIQELLIEGRDFFNGDKKIALENLPAFTVKKVKVYRKVPFDAYLTRKDRGEKASEADPMVLNVCLKAKYQNGFIGNTQLAGGLPTQESADLLYLWHIFGLHYNKRRSFGVNLNTNNINDAGRALSDGAWSSNLKEEGEVKNTLCKVDYSYTNPEKRMTVNSSLRLTNKNQYIEQTNSSMEYLTDGNLYETSINELNGSSLTAAWNGKFMYPSRNFTVQLLPQIDIGHYRSLSNNRSATLSENLKYGLQENMLGNFSQEDVFGHGMDSILIHRQSIHSEDKSEALNSVLGSMFTIRIPFLKQALFINSDVSFSTTKLQQHTYNQIYYSINQNNDNRDLYRTDHSYRSNVSIDISNVLFSRRRKARHAEIRAAFRIKYSQNGRNNDLFNMNQLDSWNESFDWEHLPNLESLYSVQDTQNSFDITEKDLGSQLTIKGSYDFTRDIGLTSSFPIQLKYRSIIDKRDNDKISLLRYDWLVHPSFSMRYKKFTIGYHLSQSLPALRDLIERTDDSNPLMINIGNSALKKSVKHSPYVNMDMSFNQSRSSLSVSLEYDYYQNLIKLMNYKDLQTGKTILQQRNVNGDWTSRISCNYRQVLDKSNHWVLNINMKGEIGLEGIYDHVENAGTSVSHAATKGLLFNNIDLTYMTANFGFAFKSNNRWYHTKSLQNFFNNTNYFDFVNGASIKAFLWHHIHLDSDIMWRIKGGAENSKINQNNVIWNLSLSGDLTGHWTIKAEGFDILRQLSSTYFNSNATGWTVSQKNVMSSYFMLHVTYRFNILPK